MNRLFTYKGVIVTLLLLFVCAFAYGQGGGVTVKGRVSNKDGSPLPGALVVVTNAPSATAAMSDKDGNYEIRVPNTESILEVSILGNVTTSQVVGSRTKVDFVLESEDYGFDDVVVIGYGTIKKSHVSGSISKLDGAALVDRPVSSLTSALQGQMTGLSVRQTTSEVGTEPEVRVRGIGSINASSEPLVVVDGFPLDGGLATINMSDVSSIEVLKDAASAAIYGSRAANGVIMVTTKSGVANKPTYNIKFYSGFKYAYKLHDMMNSQEYLDLLTWQESVGATESTAIPGANARSAVWLEENIGYTNWQKEALRTALINKVEFSMGGGGDKTTYRVSASYDMDEGVMIQNRVDKVNFRTRVDSRLSRVARIGINVSGMYQKRERPVRNFIDFYRTPSFLPVMHNERSTALTGYTGLARGSHFNKITTPTGALDDNGNPTWEESSPFTSSNPSPMSIMNNTSRSDERFQGRADVYLRLQLAKGLEFKTSNGVSIDYMPAYLFYKKNALAEGAAASAKYSNNFKVRLLTENTLNYNVVFNKKHELSALLGYTLQSDRNDLAVMTGTGFANDNIESLNAATIFSLAETNNGVTDGTGTFWYPKEILESYLGRVNYSYADKYIFSASLRMDKSSKFRKGNRDAWFPSVSAAWRIDQEEFMMPVTWISGLKARVSWGVTGNNNIPYDAVYDLLSITTYPFGTGNSYSTGYTDSKKTKSNPDITWEQTNEWNYGLDVAFLRNRIQLSFDYYYSITKDLLLVAALPSYSGYTGMWDNVGRVRNQGIEIQINSINMDRKNFTWETSFNISGNRNKVVELGGEYQFITSGERNEAYLARVGSPLVQYFGYKSIGVWETQEEIDANPSFVGDKPGYVRVADTDGSGSLSEADRVPLGNPYPDFTWGMNNSFYFYNFDVSFFLHGVQGISVFNGDMYYNESFKWNKAYIKNRWTSQSHPGEGKIPLYKTDRTLLSDLPIEDASYMSLANVTLGYTFKQSALKKIGVSRLRIYASADNLLNVWSKGYRGIAPEARTTSGAYSSPLTGGYQRGGFPVTATITFGLDINF